jgi:hypothetical protein
MWPDHNFACAHASFGKHSKDRLVAAVAEMSCPYTF